MYAHRVLASPDDVYATWQDALPFALAVARKLARRQPYALDVDSLVMEALWRAQTSGAVLSKGYVRCRISGAVKDEMRRVAEGQRGNYQGVRAFVDVEDMLELRDEASDGDPIDAIDRRRAIEALPDAARFLVRETVVGGKTQEDIARDLRVSAVRVFQVVERLKAEPSSVTRVPGRIDLRSELRQAMRLYLRRVVEEGTSNRAELARAMGTARSTAYQWTRPEPPLPTGIVEGTGGPLQVHLHAVGIELARKAFERAKGSTPVAARLLGISLMTARRWRRQLGAVADSRYRHDLSTAAMAELRAQGLSNYAIAKRLGCDRSLVRRRLRRAIP